MVLAVLKLLKIIEVSWPNVWTPILIAYGLFILRLLYAFVEDKIKEEYNKWKKKK